jgi:hypothetical protein
MNLLMIKRIKKGKKHRSLTWYVDLISDALPGKGE